MRRALQLSDQGNKHQCDRSLSVLTVLVAVTTFYCLLELMGGYRKRRDAGEIPFKPVLGMLVPELASHHVSDLVESTFRVVTPKLTEER